MLVPYYFMKCINWEQKTTTKKTTTNNNKTTPTRYVLRLINQMICMYVNIYMCQHQLV